MFPLRCKTVHHFPVVNCILPYSADLCVQIFFHQNWAYNCVLMTSVADIVFILSTNKSQKLRAYAMSAYYIGIGKILFLNHCHQVSFMSKKEKCRQDSERYCQGSTEHWYGLSPTDLQKMMPL